MHRFMANNTLPILSMSKA